MGFRVYGWVSGLGFGVYARFVGLAQGGTWRGTRAHRVPETARKSPCSMRTPLPGNLKAGRVTPLSLN